MCVVNDLKYNVFKKGWWCEPLLENKVSRLSSRQNRMTFFPSVCLQSLTGLVLKKKLKLEVVTYLNVELTDWRECAH